MTAGPGVIKDIIIHQTHYEKSDWSRAFNQFTIACELDIINAISAVYHVKFKVCLVTKHDIMNYQNLVSVLSASALGFGR